MRSAEESRHHFQYFVILAILLYRINDCFSKALVGDMGVFELLFYRSIVTLAIFPILMWRKNIDYRCFFEKSIFLRNLLAAIALYFEVAALEYLSLGAFILLTYTAPIFIKIFARLILKEQISWFELGLIAVSVVGTMFIIEVSFDRQNTEGVVYALLGALFYALSIIATKCMREQDSNSVYFSYVMVLFLLSFIKLPDFLPTATELCTLFIMVFFHIAAFLLHLKGLLALKTSRAAVLEYIGLVFALALDYAVWGNILTVEQGLGGGLIVFSCILSLYRERAITLLKKAFVPFRKRLTVDEPNSSKE